MKNTTNLEKKMNKLIFENRIKGAVCFVISGIAMSMTAIYYYRVGKISGVKDTADQMVSLFDERKGENNE